MSHISTIKTEVKDKNAIRAACDRLGHKITGENERSVTVKFSDWHNAVSINLTTGEMSFDNYGGRWGSEQTLTDFINRYGCEKAKIEAMALGFSFDESYNEETHEIGLRIYN